MVDFHCDLSNNKSPQVCRTLLSILADLNKPEVWMVLMLSSSNVFPSRWLVGRLVGWLGLMAYQPL